MLQSECNEEFANTSHMMQSYARCSQETIVSLPRNFRESCLTFLLRKTKTEAARCLRVMTKWGRNPQQLYKHCCAPHEINILQLGGSDWSTTCVFKWQRRIWTSVLTETWQGVEFVHKETWHFLFSIIEKNVCFPQLHLKHNVIFCMLQHLCTSTVLLPW